MERGPAALTTEWGWVGDPCDIAKQFTNDSEKEVVIEAKRRGSKPAPFVVPRSFIMQPTKSLMLWMLFFSFCFRKISHRLVSHCAFVFRQQAKRTDRMA